MSKKQKLLKKALSGSKNFSFKDFVTLVEAFGFQLDRISGSHHIFIHPNLPDIVNIQNAKGKAKPYQLEDFLAMVETYQLNLQD
jgi:predicted RNA binding protein YcfA (HicA-like mRNA interferase family)